MRLDWRSLTARWAVRPISQVCRLMQTNCLRRARHSRTALRMLSSPLMASTPVSFAGLIEANFAVSEAFLTMPLALQRRPSGARMVYSPFILAWSLIVAAQTHLFRRDACAAERAAREAITLAREHGLPQWMAFGQQCLGRVLCQQGDWRGGIELQREAMDSLHAAGSLLHTT